MASGVFVCPYCKRNNFHSSRGLSQHQQQNALCNKRLKQAVGVAQHRIGIAHDFMPTVKVKRTYGRQLTGGIAETLDRIQQENHDTLTETPDRAQNHKGNKQQSSQTSQQLMELAETDDNSLVFLGDDEYSNNDDEYSDESITNVDLPIVVNSGNIIQHLGKSFQEYTLVYESGKIVYRILPDR